MLNSIIKTAKEIFVDYMDYSNERLVCYYSLLKSILKGSPYSVQAKDISISKLNYVIETYLSEKQRKCCKLYYGLDTGKRKTITQIAKNDDVEIYAESLVNGYVLRATTVLCNYLHVFSLSEQSKAKATNNICLLDISIRARRALEYVGICSINDLLSMNRKEISQIYGLGVKSTEEVWSALESYRETTPVSIADDEVSISVLGLSNRVYNALRRAGIGTVSELLKLTSKDLTKVNNIGNDSVHEIITKKDAFLKNVKSN